MDKISVIFFRRVKQFALIIGLKAPQLHVAILKKTIVRNYNLIYLYGRHVQVF